MGADGRVARLAGPMPMTLTNGSQDSSVGAGAATAAPNRSSRFLVRLATVSVAVLFSLSLLPSPALAAPNASVNLDQCQNGKVGPPLVSTSPCTWVNGNLNENKAHYYEGESIPYRAVVSNLAPGSSHALDIGWDIKHSGGHAIDYLTHYQRIAETVNPCAGVSPCSFGGTFAVPLPAGSPQPQASFNALPAADRMVTAYGGTITGLSYLSQGSLTAAQSESSLRISFTAGSSGTVVLSWGGHIGAADDWGAGNATAGINGAPYHMRIKALDGSGGNQDRSLSAAAVVPVGPQGASLTVVKEVLNDEGGTLASADFSIHVRDAASADVNGSPAPGDAFGRSYVGLPAGDYSIGEDAVDGYALTISGDCAADGSVTLLDGDIKTCVLTNEDEASFLTVIKRFVNDDGGDADLGDVSLLIDGQAVGSGNASQVSPGNHSVSEDGPAGYNATIAGDCAADGSVSVPLGASKVCLITNDDIAPILTVTKVVVNDDGGDATVASFPLFVDDLGVASGVPAVLEAGDYVVSETGSSGYAAAITGDCDANGNVSLAPGDVKSCTITNDDIAPRLTVTKVVTNDDGGSMQVSDFPLFVDGQSVLSGEEHAYLAGSHQASESGSAGYAASFSGDCDEDGNVSLAPGDVKSCTITNDDIRPLLTVVKIVVNDNGGQAEIEDALLFVDDLQVTSGEQNGFDAGSYVVTEQGPFGYASEMSGDCDAGGNVTLAPGDVKVCVFTNDDIQPLLTVTKIVVNDNGGEAIVADFLLYVGTQLVLSGEQNGFDAGNYTVSEDGPSGYAGSIAGDCAEDGDVSLSVGEVKSCTITNDDIQPKLTVTKVVVNDDGGSAVVADFPLFVDGQSVLSGDEHGFDAGEYSVSETGLAGYAASFSGDCDANGTVSLAVGDEKECTITNDDIAPKLTVTKVVVNDDGGLLAVADFPLSVDGSSVLSGDEHAYLAGLHSVAENGSAGYSASFSGDCDANGTVLLAPGDVKSCTITNDDVAPRLTVLKMVTNDNGGSAEVADFALDVSGTAFTSGDAQELSAGDYRVSESGPAGYEGTFSGDCDEDGNVSLALADDKLCILTNDDQPAHLRVIKVLILDSGGQAEVGDFSIHVEAAGAGPSDFAAEADPGTLVELDAGNYSVTEEEHAEFQTTYSADCSGAIALGEERTCTITNDDISLATRTQGFWSTHTDFTKKVFSTKLGGSMTVGTGGHVRTIDTDGKLFGAWYSDIAKTTTGAKRTDLDQARMILLQQLVTARLNCAAFGCAAGTWALISQANAAFAGSSASAMLASAAALDAYNNSGDSEPIPSSLGSWGKAAAQQARNLANKVFWNSP